ncbi:MAG TPA: Na+/H+ antiporter NhaC [Flavobacteriales bacterium]|nr:Na+/H+ antiporter NhaC [Flavobacteriales bacterium]HRJ36546.1 Na+/H+ antiporter NhaC [Flavobacteriales bacterium]HRJ39234.1 Na+/H+ antiporter NhaC [Flavobacteriales bacterium]
MSAPKNTPVPGLFISFLPILVLVGFLTINVKLYGDSATSGPNQIALILTAAFAGIIAWRYGLTWTRIRDGIMHSIIASLPAVMILLLIGALAGTWMISGVVPTMIYYGLKILHPAIFLLAATIVCAIVSLATGSSWSTVATVGAALLGIGSAMGFHEGMIAGAIISGAYFGDKMSPLSDTTNLAPAMAGTDLFTHIRYMTITTVPSLAITLLIFLVLGFTAELNPVAGGVDSLMSAIDSKFYVSPVLFLVPSVVIFLIIKKVDAVPALLIGTLLGGIFAVIFQPEVVNEISGITSDYVKSGYSTIMNAMMGPVSVHTSDDQINSLLSTKGMGGMLNTIWLIICAMSFGGIMEVSGMLQKISSTVVNLARSTGSLIASTAGTCIFFNATAADQYLSIVVPGRMYAKTYRDRGLKPENLSRTLEDSGTVTSVLFPWNTCGATQAGVLGVATGTYWMYCFFNLISPIMTIAAGYLNYRIARYSEEEMKAMNQE